MLCIATVADGDGKRVRLWPCKIDLSPPVILNYLSFQGDTSVVVFIVFALMLNFCAFST